MGDLTESMVRLRDEILLLRHNRETLRAELERSARATRSRVAALRRAIRNDLEGARRAWLGSTLGVHPSLAVEGPGPAVGIQKPLFKKRKKH